MITRKRELEINSDTPDFAGAFDVARFELDKWTESLRRQYFGEKTENGMVLITGMRPDGRLVLEWEESRARLRECLLLGDSSWECHAFVFSFVLEIDDPNEDPIDTEDGEQKICRQL